MYLKSNLYEYTLDIVQICKIAKYYNLTRAVFSVRLQLVTSPARARDGFSFSKDDLRAFVLTSSVVYRTLHWWFNATQRLSCWNYFVLSLNWLLLNVTSVNKNDSVLLPKLRSRWLYSARALLLCVHGLSPVESIYTHSNILPSWPKQLHQ